MSEPDLFSAAGARDAALEQVADNAGPIFMARAQAAIAKLYGEWTGEDIRLALLRAGIIPHHHNAWGAVISKAVKRGMLVPTGRWVGMKTTRSHARRTPVYWAGG